MNGRTKLQLLKLLHTLVWVFFNAVIFYMAFAVLTNRLDWRLWTCYGLIVLEGLVLLTFRLFCPLTIWARKYSASTAANFDIWLPNWLAKYNKQIYTSIVVVITVVLVVKLVK